MPLFRDISEQDFPPCGEHAQERARLDTPSRYGWDGAFQPYKNSAGLDGFFLRISHTAQATVWESA